MRILPVVFVTTILRGMFMPHGHEHQIDMTCVGLPCSLIIVNPKRS